MFFGKKPLTRDSARNAALVNQLVTPGLGTIMAGKLWLGFAQLALALAGFGFVLTWFVTVLRQYYGQITGHVEVRPVGWIGLVGAGLFAAAWVWSLITRIGLIHEARRNAAAGTNVPPVISP